MPVLKFFKYNPQLDNWDTTNAFVLHVVFKEQFNKTNKFA